MDMVKKCKRFEIYLICLDPTIGKEIRKTRPCVIISPNEMNEHLDTVIIAPLTTTIRDYPTRIDLKFRGKKGQIVLDQVRTVDKRRLVQKLGTISEATSRVVTYTLVETFEF